MKVVVVNHCSGLRVDRKLLAKAVRFVARQHNVTAGQIELAIFSDDDMARLHKQYLHRRAVTDVICFDLTPATNTPGQRSGGFSVSLALGGQVARRQARVRKTSINKELSLYAVHGLLHTLGYNDDTPKNAKRMHAREDELLAQLGLGAVYRNNAS
ncbi:MAG: rRNA maturation RNase YbeY [Actinobacteria bacterium]|nr:rRNA maturation RNase YbeY [Actinomycetota bacterium]